jgi:ammonium transporter, Amt family
MVGGIVGGVLLGFFADRDAIADGDFANGLFFGGGADLLIDQLAAIGSVIAFAFVVTFAIAKVLDATVGLRVPEEVEVRGLDLRRSTPRPATTWPTSGSLDPRS